MRFVVAFLFVCSFGSPAAAFSQQKKIDSAKDKITFAKRKIALSGHTLTVEIADTDTKRARGLMYRTSLEPESGMLFVFGTELPLAFWMKNTLIPLSIAYFDKSRRIVDIQEMVPAVAGELYPATYPSKLPAMYALEMPKGWFKKNGIKPGASFTFKD
jgi:uncharacterized protein